MTSERWRRIEELYRDALERPPGERAAFVADACRDDRDLRSHVEALLSGEGTEPALSELAPGDRLGPYIIEAPLGAGAMGRVYKARDTRLGRPVAVKIVTPEFSGRFEREARAISSLNHPNVCTLHDVGPDYLVMELVEGETLAHRLKRGPVPVDEAVEIALQIAGALEAAHERGIVHRDLKPANIKITPAGVVKVLDFGLAKFAADALPRDFDSTQPLTLTRVGSAVGTPAYMAPEQASGRPVDKRADIWALGVILYEMLAGRPLFRGGSVSEVLARVLTAEPEWELIPAKTRRLLRLCLTRDPNQRLRDAGDARFLLEDSAPPPRAGSALPWKLGAGALAVAAALALGFAWFAWRQPASGVLRFTVDLGPEAALAPRRGSQMALSPDGSRLVYVSGQVGPTARLWLRRLDQPKSRFLAGSEGAESPFLSPDGKWIAFFADGKLKKMDADGGAPVAICDVPAHRGGSWGEDGDIIFSERGDGGLWRVSAAGGVPRRVTQPDRAKGEDAHRYPQILPGGGAVLFLNFLNSLSGEGAIDVQSLRTGERKRLVRTGAYPRYLPSGHLVYWHKGILYAAPMDAKRLALTGAPAPILEDVDLHRGTGSASYAFSESGLFVYDAIDPDEFPRPVVMVDESGKTSELPLAKGRYSQVRISPDGSRLAITMTEGPEEHTAIYDFRTGQISRLPFLAGNSGFPVWSPDGKWLLFSFDAESPGPGVYAIRADLSGAPQRLIDGADLVPWSISPGMDKLLYAVIGGPKDGTYALSLKWSDGAGPQAGPEERIAEQTQAAFSSDGKWLVYDAVVHGDPHIFVRPARGPGQWQISPGYDGRWAPHGAAVFFRELPGFRVASFSYSVNGDSFSAGPVRMWTRTPVDSFDVMPDGKRAVVIPGGPGQKESTRATFLVNFIDDLRRRIPPGK